MRIMQAVAIIAAIVAACIGGFSSARATDVAQSSLPDYLQTTRAAAQPSPDPVVIDNKEIPKTNAIGGFLQAALIRHVGSSYSSPSDLLPAYVTEKVSWPFFKPENIKQHYPWLEPYLFSNREAPRALAISKWTKPIRISLGLPNDMKPYSPPLYNGKPVTEYPEWPHILDEQKRPVLFEGLWMPPGYGKELNPEAKQIASDEAKLLAPTLTRLTGLSVEFVQDEGNDPSNMRIVLSEASEADFWATEFKRNGFVTNGMGFRQIVEDKLDGAIFFTPLYGSYQVDGFFIASPENEIEFSVCYIRDDHDAVLLQKLVRECLVRSLGFPEFQNTLKNSYLNAWNGRELPKEKLDALKNSITDVLGKDAAQEFLLNNTTYLSFKKSPVDDLTLGSADLNESDKYLIRLLYSGVVKPGMSKAEVFNALNKP